jgi:hypothetical protein
MRRWRIRPNPIGNRVRRDGGRRKSAVTHQPGLPAALEALIEDAIRGDPCSPLRWVSRSLRHLKASSVIKIRGAFSPEIYPAQVRTRKSLGEMMRKLSVT